MSIIDYQPAWNSQALTNPIVKMVREAMEHAKRQRERLESDWIENVRMMNGNHFQQPDFQMERVEVNMFWADARVMSAALFMKEPYYLVKPQRPQDVASAPIMEAVINKYVQSTSMNLKRVVRKVTIDAMNYPFGVCKTGYVLDDVQVEVAIDRKTGQVRLLDKTKRTDLAEHAIERRVLQVGSRPVLNRVSPRAFFIDPRATGLEDAEWVCEEIVRHVDDVRADPSYRNTEKLQPSARFRDSASINTPMRTEFYGPIGRGSTSNDSGPYANGPLVGSAYDADLLVLWEFWHRPTHSLYVVTPYGHEPLREDRGKWPYDHEDWPYHILNLTVPVSDELYPMPVMSAAKPQQREINSFRSQQIDFVKRSRTKYLVDSGLMDPSSLAALQRGDGIPIVMVNADPRTVVYPMEGPRQTPEFHLAMQEIKEDSRRTTGIAEFYHGGASTGEARTATEQRLIAGSTSMVTDMQRDGVLDMCLSIGRATMGLIKQFADRTEIIRISGRSDFEWREWSKKDIQGMYDLEIKPGSQLTTDPSVVRQQVLDMFSITAPIAIQTGRINFDELLKVLVRNYGDLVPDPERLLMVDDSQKPPTDPQAEEILFAQGGMPVGSPNDPHPMHIQVHMQGYQQSKSQEDAYRRLAHIKWHMDQHTQQQVTMMAQAQMQAQMSQGGPQGAGGVRGGQGRKSPEPGFPIAPRQFAQGPVDSTSFARGMSRREGVGS